MQYKLFFDVGIYISLYSWVQAYSVAEYFLLISHYLSCHLNWTFVWGRGETGRFFSSSLSFLSLFSSSIFKEICLYLQIMIIFLYNLTQIMYIYIIYFVDSNFWKYFYFDIGSRTICLWNFRQYTTYC